MPRVVLTALLCVGLVTGCGGGGTMPVATSTPSAGAVVAQRQVAPRQLDLTVRSSALGRTAQVRLLTPVGWTSSARRRWPVLYLLRGCCDTYESWTRSTDVERLPQLRDVLVVMPEGDDVGFYANWRDGPRWQDFHLRELPRILADRFVRRAQALGIPVQADLYGAGVHNWPYWQRELHRALPLLLGAMR